MFLIGIALFVGVVLVLIILGILLKRRGVSSSVIENSGFIIWGFIAFICAMEDYNLVLGYMCIPGVLVVLITTGEIFVSPRKSEETVEEKEEEATK